MADIAVLGLAVMGANLARNFASRGHRVFVYNRTAERTDRFMADHGNEGTFVATKTLTELVAAMPAPRVLLMMVKAGAPVDELIAELLPHLSAGDTLIDGGNSHYRDTERRVRSLEAQGIAYIGMGVSGGEEGALKGPSMMPGGTPEALAQHFPLLASAAAPDGLGGTCIARIGPGGSGHFVKMVHNGIEYGVMQLLAETYAVLRSVGGLQNPDISTLLSQWNSAGPLRSFLVEITAHVLQKKDDETGRDLVDVIKDAAGQKGTGKWTTDAALSYGVAVPTITAAVDARIISGDWSLRQQLADVRPTAPAEDIAAIARQALELATMISYTQGFVLIARASAAEQWQVNLGDAARVWRQGCIIRSELLGTYQERLGTGIDPLALLTSMQTPEQLSALRHLVASCASSGIPVPCFASALAYIESYRTARLPQNIIQAQRDFFGAHTYERLDKPGTFHTQW